MDVSEAIRTRRSLRILDDRPILNESLVQLLDAARLAPSCYNNQPWRYIIVRGSDTLDNLKGTLPEGNAWATKAGLILVVASRAEDDCQIAQRQYHQFDCGLSIGQLVLQATELGLIAHPIAGYSPKKVGALLHIPEEYLVIALVICGYPGSDDSLLSANQRETEKTRPARKLVSENFFEDEWGKPVQI